MLVRLAQRVPVRINLDVIPGSVRLGQGNVCYGAGPSAQFVEAAQAMTISRPTRAGARGHHVDTVIRTVSLGRVPIKWNHLIDRDSLKIKELEHVRIEKVEQLFRDML